jgi:hypothetical protein
MSSPKQIEANRQNAQSSTGPTSATGKERSSLNATRHGFTGQTLVVSTEEKEAYEFHCLSYQEKYAPATHEETSLVQQCADLDWSIHQIFVQQSNMLTLINTITVQLMKEGGHDAVPAAIAPLQKSLGTFSIYETRKRRAAQQVLTRLTALQDARREAVAKAAAIYKALKTQNKPFIPADFGFDCSLPEIELYLKRETAAEKALKSPSAS